MRANRKQPNFKAPQPKSKMNGAGQRSSLGDLSYSKASQQDDGFIGYDMGAMGGNNTFNCFYNEISQNHCMQESEKINTQKRQLDIKAEEIQRMEQQKRLQEEKEEYSELEEYLQEKEKNQNARNFIDQAYLVVTGDGRHQESIDQGSSQRDEQLLSEQQLVSDSELEDYEHLDEQERDYLNMPKQMAEYQPQQPNKQSQQAVANQALINLNVVNGADPKPESQQSGGSNQSNSPSPRVYGQVPHNTQETSKEFAPGLKQLYMNQQNTSRQAVLKHQKIEDTGMRRMNSYRQRSQHNNYAQDQLDNLMVSAYGYRTKACGVAKCGKSAVAQDSIGPQRVMTGYPMTKKLKMKPQIPKFRKQSGSAKDTKSRTRSRSKKKQKSNSRSRSRSIKNPKKLKKATPSQSNLQQPKLINFFNRSPMPNCPDIKMQKARSSGHIQEEGEVYTFQYPTQEKQPVRLNLDLAPAMSSTTPEDHSCKQLFPEEDKDSRFVEFLKNIQLYLQQDESTSPKKNDAHLFQNLQFLREKYKQFEQQQALKNQLDTTYFDYQPDVLNQDEDVLLLSADLRSGDYPVLLTTLSQERQLLQNQVESEERLMKEDEEHEKNPDGKAVADDRVQCRSVRQQKVQTRSKSRDRSREARKSDDSKSALSIKKQLEAQNIKLGCEDTKNTWSKSRKSQSAVKSEISEQHRKQIEFIDQIYQKVVLNKKDERVQKRSAEQSLQRKARESIQRIQGQHRARDSRGSRGSRHQRSGSMRSGLVVLDQTTHDQTLKSSEVNRSQNQQVKRKRRNSRHQNADKCPRSFNQSPEESQKQMNQDLQSIADTNANGTLRQSAMVETPYHQQNTNEGVREPPILQSHQDIKRIREQLRGERSRSYGRRQRLKEQLSGVFHQLNNSHENHQMTDFGHSSFHTNFGQDQQNPCDLSNSNLDIPTPASMQRQVQAQNCDVQFHGQDAEQSFIAQDSSMLGPGQQENHLEMQRDVQSTLMNQIAELQQKVNDPCNYSVEQVSQTLAELNQTAQELKKACEGINDCAKTLKSQQQIQLQSFKNNDSTKGFSTQETFDLRMLNKSRDTEAPIVMQAPMASTVPHQYFSNTEDSRNPYVQQQNRWQDKHDVQNSQSARSANAKRQEQLEHEYRQLQRAAQHQHRPSSMSYFQTDDLGSVDLTSNQNPQYQTGNGAMQYQQQLAGITHSVHDDLLNRSIMSNDMHVNNTSGLPNLGTQQEIRLQQNEGKRSQTYVNTSKSNSMDARNDAIAEGATEADVQDAAASVATSRLYSIYGVTQTQGPYQKEISDDMIHQTTNRGSNLSNHKGSDEQSFINTPPRSISESQEILHKVRSKAQMATAYAHHANLQPHSIPSLSSPFAQTTTSQGQQTIGTRQTERVGLSTGPGTLMQDKAIVINSPVSQTLKRENTLTPEEFERYVITSCYVRSSKCQTASDRYQATSDPSMKYTNSSMENAVPKHQERHILNSNEQANGRKLDIIGQSCLPRIRGYKPESTQKLNPTLYSNPTAYKLEPFTIGSSVISHQKLDAQTIQSDCYSISASVSGHSKGATLNTQPYDPYKDISIRQDNMKPQDPPRLALQARLLSEDARTEPFVSNEFLQNALLATIKSESSVGGQHDHTQLMQHHPDQWQVQSAAVIPDSFSFRK